MPPELRKGKAPAAKKPATKSTKAKTTDLRRTLGSPKIVKDKPHRLEGSIRAKKIAKQSGLQQPEEQNETGGDTRKRSRKQPAELHPELNARLTKSAFIASWASQVNPELSPEGESRQLGAHPDWYRGNGYESSDKDMESQPNATTSAQSIKLKKGQLRPAPLIPGSAGFASGLEQRNVEFEAVKDDCGEWLEKVIFAKCQTTWSSQDERNWQKDLIKCRASSNEAVFQRTIMMDLINRHHLEDALDYTCESQWANDCTIPQRSTAPAIRLPKPRPDLAVAFKTKSILGSFKQADLQVYKSLMCPESSLQDKRDRAFHFLSIEAKQNAVQVGDAEAQDQNFNTASHALHNIYFFMKMAGQESLTQFYEKVRFFSVVATGRAFHVRAHRAVQVEDGRIVPSYPLGFMYDVLHECEGENYTRAKAASMINNILVEYGVKILQPILREGMEKAWKALKDQNEVLSIPGKGQVQGVLREEAEAQRRQAQARSRLS